jgi:hypothetical protein
MKNLLAGLIVIVMAASVAKSADVPSIEKQEPNTWVKRSPLPGGPPSPQLGYESSFGYDQRFGKLVRWGGHDPGGGGPQLSETWTFDLKTNVWELLTPNNNPPGNCCCRESVMDPTSNLFYRFSHPSFGHGWMWDRSRYLREDSVWTFDLAANRWVNMRPGREPHLNVGKPALYDPNHQVIWVYDIKLRAYDPYTNMWHWVNESTKVTDSDKPVGKRTYAGMALDPERNKIVLFGDHYQSDPRTLVYDIGVDEWTDMKPKNSPPAIRSCPTMVYDSIHKIMICVMLGGKWDTTNEADKHLETWTYDLGKNEWTKMDVQGGPDYFGTRDRLMTYCPDQNIVVLESRSDKEQQIWTYRYKVTDPPPIDPTPKNLIAEVMEGGKVRLKWEGQKGATYLVYRGTGDQPWKAKFKSIRPQAVGTAFLVDSGPELGKVNYYYVTSFPPRDDTVESAPSTIVRTQPHLIVDSRVDVLAKDKVVYSWKKSADPDVTGYVVERAVIVPISAAQKIATAKEYDSPIPLTAMAEKAILGEWHRLTEKPIPTCEYADAVDLTQPAEPGKSTWTALFSPRAKGEPATRPEDDKSFDMTKPGCPFTIYAYRVRAVNRLGVEGGPSPYQLTIPNEVEGLFTREDGKDVHLRWQASPHASIRGYYVFRLNGREPSISLLTPEPIKEMTFTDKTADGRARRYYVVVADAIGQQGIPTHEAWAFREWRQLYSRFYAKDGWHQ